MLYAKQRQFSKAQELFEEGRRGGDAEAATFLGMLYSQQGQLSEALELYEEGRRGGDARAARVLAGLDAEASQPPPDHCSVSGPAQRGQASATLAVPAADPSLPPPGALRVGDRVLICGLVSPASQELNGRAGAVRRDDRAAGRFGVEMDGDSSGAGLRAIKASNLIPVGETEDTSPAEQEAIAASLAAASSTPPQGELDVNAQVSEALLRSREEPERRQPAPHVLLISYSRSPEPFREALLDATELASSRAALEARGFATELRAGAKVLVLPEHYEPLLESLHQRGFDPDERFTHWHLFLEPPLEEVVDAIVERVNQQLKHNKKIYKKPEKVTVPLSHFAVTAARQKRKQVVLRTFIELVAPPSLYSAGSGGPRTETAPGELAVAIDAVEVARKRPNPREKVPRQSR